MTLVRPKHMKIIIGLGNPGPTYAGTRHNVGFECVDLLAKELDLSWREQKKCQASIATGIVDGISVLLAKPTTFMNLSGTTVAALRSYYKVNLEELLIIQDEMDLEPGRLAFLAKGGPAGHNGITDIHERLATKDVARLRLGVGRPTGPIPTEDWVLGRPQTDDQEKIRHAIIRGAEAVQTWIREGLVKAMNEWNKN